MNQNRRWLDVPFSEKDAAKAAGAYWDAAARRWYAPRPGMTGLERWVALPDVPNPLPGEDRSLGSGLFVDLVPSSCWFTNVRSCVDQRDWERLRRMVIGRTGGRCEACGAGRDPARQLWLEAHERWDYDERSFVQRLRRLVCLCSDCHQATHFGLAQSRGLDVVAIGQLMRVNRWSEDQAWEHVDEALIEWSVRSADDWTLDLGILTGAGVRIAAPAAAADRRDIAAARTEAERSTF